MCYVVFVSVNLANFEDLAGPEDLVDPGNLEDLEDSKNPLFPGRAPKALSVDEEEPAGGEEDAFLQARDNDDTSGICRVSAHYSVRNILLDATHNLKNRRQSLTWKSLYITTDLF